MIREAGLIPTPVQPKKLQVEPCWWGEEVTGTVEQIMEYLKTQNPNHECVISISNPKAEKPIER